MHQAGKRFAVSVSPTSPAVLFPQDRRGDSLHNNPAQAGENDKVSHPSFSRFPLQAETGLSFALEGRTEEAATLRAKRMPRGRPHRNQDRMKISTERPLRSAR
jgi:hypothetical protein